jgi:outer membrane protein assembly factor BamA
VRTPAAPAAAAAAILSLVLTPASLVLAQPPPADSLEGRIVREIRIGPVQRSSTADLVRRHLATREGEAFTRARLADDYRRLDTLRLFSSIELEPRAAGDEVVLEVRLRETLKLLPYLALSVTDENGLSLGPAVKGIDLLGLGTRSAITTTFGGATVVGARVERTTITPGTWAFAVQADYQSRENELFQFDEAATNLIARAGWNWTSRVQTGGRVDLAWVDTRSSDIALSPDGSDALPGAGAFLVYNALDSITNPRAGWFGQVDVQRLGGDAGSWSLTLDARRFQPLGARSTLSVVAFALLQSGTVGADVPEYRQVGLGGENSVRGWALGSRIGKNQAIGTVEWLRTLVPVTPFSVFGFNLYGGVQAAAFADVGAAWTDRFAASKAIDGYGIGLRVLVPFVDVIRLDAAVGEPGRGVTIAVGIALKADKQRERVR